MGFEAETFMGELAEKTVFFVFVGVAVELLALDCE